MNYLKNVIGLKHTYCFHIKLLLIFLIINFSSFNTSTAQSLIGNMLFSNDYMTTIGSFKSFDNHLIIVRSSFYSPSLVNSTGTILKYDSAGSLVNYKTFIVDTPYTYRSISKCIPTKDNGLLLMVTLGFNGLKYDVIKLDSMLNVQWSKKFYINSFNYTFTEQIAELDDLSIIVSGEIYNNSVKTKMMITKLDNNGNIQWEKAYKDSLFFSGYELRPGLSLATSDGGFLIGGIIGGLGGKIFISKFDTSGSMQWMKTYHDTVNQTNFYPLNLQKSYDGGYFISGGHVLLGGSYPICPFLMKIDSVGNNEWANFYDDDKGSIQSVNEMINGDLLITGTDSANSSIAGMSIFILKTNNLGDTLWTKNYGGTVAYNLYESNDSLILMALADYFPYNHPIIALLKLDSLGNFNCNQRNSSNNFQNINSIVKSNYQLTLTYDSIIVEPDSIIIDTILNLTYVDYCLYTSTNDNIIDGNYIQLYPNPVTEVLYLQFPPELKEQPFSLFIYNSIGQNIHTIKSVFNIEISVTSLLPGIYTIILKSNNGKMFSSRFIKLSSFK